MYSVYIGDKKVSEEAQLLNANQIAVSYANGDIKTKETGKIIIKDGMGNIIRECNRSHKKESEDISNVESSNEMYLVQLLREVPPTRMMGTAKAVVLASSSSEASLKARLFLKTDKNGRIRDMRTSPIKETMVQDDNFVLIP